MECLMRVPDSRAGRRATVYSTRQIARSSLESLLLYSHIRKVIAGQRGSEGTRSGISNGSLDAWH
jgi:hypothetical protein